MIKNYLKTAWRSLLQNKTTSLISTAGLAVGIGCFLLLATYILNELSYDRFNVNADRIVRLIQHSRSVDDNEEQINAVTPTGPVPVFKQELSEIADGVRVYNYSDYRPAAVQYRGQLFNERRMLMADGSFFKIFSFKFLEGNPASALSQINSVVITSSTAKKYFGNDDALGKILKVNSVRNLMVTGIIADVPPCSQIKFDLMGNYAMLARSATRNWNSSNDYSYFLLKPGTNIHTAEHRMNAYADNLFNDDIDKGHRSWYTLESLTSVHLYTKANDNLDVPGDIKYIYILSIIAVILLLLACINFLNLVTAKSIERAREIGVRKVMGAMRGQLFTQFIVEAAIITLVSLIVGLLLAWLSFAWFSNFTGHQLGFQTWNIKLLIPSLLGLFIVVTLIAGTYPSLYLSAFKPIATLKGKSGSSAGSGFLRRSLVVFQFAISVFFIIGTIIAGRQLQYIQHTNTGINRSQVVVLDIGGIEYNKIKAFGNALMQQKNVKSVSASYDSPVNVRGGYTINKAEGKAGNTHLMVTAIPVERNFVNTLGIKLIAGSDFTLGDEQRVLDTNTDKRIYAFILNETAIKALGWQPDEAIGKQITMDGRQGEIRGVAHDFNFASLHQEISPIVLFPEYDYFGKMLIKTSGANMVNTIDGIKQGWKSFFPDMPFEAHFLDQEYDELYKTDQRTGGILTVFTLITIFISCLGLFGLAIFSTKQRIREIGIRKVLGAGITNIVGLISWDFLRLVVLSVLIASPVAYYIMSKWLQGFVYRINIQWWVFVLAGGLAVVIAFLTISYQSIKAAVANPVKSLRSE
jgi:putative ABC transport system permease protein